MICINCLHEKTNVTNSRTHKKTAQVWRRRSCPKCGFIATTYERPALYEELQIRDEQGQLTPFNSGRIFKSILECLEGDMNEKYDKAFWLTNSIENMLVTRFEAILSISELKDVVYTVVNQFNRVTGIQYAVRHNMINKIQRGRPPKN